MLDPASFAIEKTAALAKLLFGSAKAARRRSQDAHRLPRDETRAAAIERAGRNLQRVAITDDGALDVKDVLRYERLVFTTAAYDANVERLLRREARS